MRNCAFVDIYIIILQIAFLFNCFCIVVLVVDILFCLQYNCDMENLTEKQTNPQLFVCKVAKKVGKVQNALRQQEIDNCQNDVVKREKYTVWQLLCHAVKYFCGKDLQSLHPIKNPNGRWTCEKIYFSLSHSHGVCVVVLDNCPIGVDIQLWEKDRFDTKLLNRIATPEEWQMLAQQTLQQLPQEEQSNATLLVEPQQILSLWCKKEALFKKLDLPRFVPNKMQTADENFVEKDLDIDGKTYHLAVATNSVEITTHFVEITEINA